MPNTPSTATLTASSVDILNAIRNSSTANYRDYIPEATSDIDSIREIGAIIMDYPALQNEFLTALVNRIGRVMLGSKLYRNPWAIFKKGELLLGETIEDIFVNIAKPFTYDVETAETQVFKREIPDVRATFYILNYQKFYKSTIQREQLRQAFLSWDGITNLIAGIVNAMYSGANYDEYNTMKYMLAKHIMEGNLKAVTVPSISTSNAKQIVSTIKGTSNNFEFMSPSYNKAHVHNYVAKEDQYIIVNSGFDAIMSVEVLAAAFNMDKAEFSGHKILVDSFATLDTDRLDELFYGQPWYSTLSSEELAALDAVPAVLVDRDWFMIFDNLMEFTEQYNGQGLYWNYWYHAWKTFAISPYANGAVFVPGTPAVTSVSVTPESVTASAGSKVAFKAEVETSYFASKEVTWSVSDTTNCSINIYGELTIGEDATGSITVTAKSVDKPSVYDTATITIAGETPTSGINKVTVVPETATVAAEGTLQCYAVVDAIGTSATTVRWSTSDTTNSSVSESGLVTLGAGATGTITITATSTVDNTKSDSCTITVGA